MAFSFVAKSGNEQTRSNHRASSHMSRPSRDAEACARRNAEARAGATPKHALGATPKHALVDPVARAQHHYYEIRAAHRDGGQRLRTKECATSAVSHRHASQVFCWPLFKMATRYCGGAQLPRAVVAGGAADGGVSNPVGRRMGSVWPQQCHMGTCGRGPDNSDGIQV